MKFVVVYRAFPSPFDRSYGGIHQSLNGDQLAYCDQARELQQRAEERLRK